MTAAKCEPKATPPEPDGSIALEGKIRQTETEKVEEYAEWEAVEDQENDIFKKEWGVEIHDRWNQKGILWCWAKEGSCMRSARGYKCL